MQIFKHNILHSKIYTSIFAVLIFTLIFGCISYAMRPETRLILCWLTSSGDGQILHSFPNPEESFVIHVVKEDCGQSMYSGEIYDCSTRLDLEFDDRVIRGHEFMSGECDAKIKWLDNIQFEVTTQSGKKRETNIVDSFGILP